MNQIVDLSPLAAWGWSLELRRLALPVASVGWAARRTHRHMDEGSRICHQRFRGRNTRKVQ